MKINLFLILIAFATEVIGTVGGFGSSVFFVPLASMVESFQLVLVLTAILHVFSNVSKLILFGKDTNWKIFFAFTISGLPFLIVGALLSNQIDVKALKLLLSIFLIIFALGMLLRPQFKINANFKSVFLSSSSSGFFAGIVGTGGAIRGLALASFNLTKNTFIATSAAVDLIIDGTRAGIYLHKGYFNSGYWYVPILALIAWFGSSLGKKILTNFSQETFRKVVLYFIMIIGVVSVFEALK